MYYTDIYYTISLDSVCSTHNTHLVVGLQYTGQHMVGNL